LSIPQAVIGQEKHRHKSKRTGQKIAGHQRRKEQFMTHFPKWRTRVRGGARNVVALGLVISVGACTDTGEFVFGSRDAASAGPAAISAGPATERDVEAPEVFDLTDEGLWDGRPSLGGVWVAHADATDPERVMIRNTENGQFVIGALFRRERENPGPSIQVSSDAAAALDILAGAPTTLHVIALRREEAPAPETPVDDGGVPVAEGEGAPSTGAALPAIAAATIAPEVDVAPALETATTASRPLLRPLDALAAPAVAELPRNMSAEDVMAGITRAAFSPEDLASTAPEPGTRPATSIAAVAEAAITESEITSAALPEVDVAPLSAPAPVAEPAAPVQVAAVNPTESTLERAYVQIGIFSVQENANNTGQTLRNAGLVPTIHDQTSNGRQLWRVVVGPAPTAEDRAAVLDTVRGLGFGDAYFVAR
jgi:rare lipoprotein A